MRCINRVFQGFFCLEVLGGDPLSLAHADQTRDRIDEIIEAIYSAALDLSEWPFALQKIADYFGDPGANGNHIDALSARRSRPASRDVADCRDVPQADMGFRSAQKHCRLRDSNAQRVRIQHVR